MTSMSYSLYKGDYSKFILSSTNILIVLQVIYINIYKSLIDGVFIDFLGILGISTKMTGDDHLAID